MIKVELFFVSFFVLGLVISQKSEEVNWMYFPDGNGVPQIMYLSGYNNSSEITSGETSDTKNGQLRSDTNIARFSLYTRKNRRNGKSMDPRKKRSDNFEGVDLFNPKLPTSIIVHGWKSSEESDTVQDIKDNLLHVMECNVIAVDWSKEADNSFYLVPAYKTREVGQEIAKLIDDLVLTQNADIRSFHLIGHSLGAHTCGYAGSFTKTGRISHITGLDPACPGFEFRGPQSRLDETDADFVEVIHTCSGAAGYAKPLGHVDFYPNKGSNQPGCPNSDPIPDIMGIACSHSRSHQFYAESIISKTGFYCYKCDSYERMLADGKCSRKPTLLMGFPVNNTARGVYYTETNSESPYARGS